MIIAEFLNLDIIAVTEMVVRYNGRCYISSTKIIAADNIADSILCELISNGINPISVTRCTTQNGISREANVTDPLLSDYVLGKCFKGISKMLTNLQKMYSLNSSAFRIATNSKTVFLSKRTSAYIAQSKGEFDEELWDFDGQARSSPALKNSQPLANRHTVDSKHYTDVPIFSPYLDLRYAKPKFGEVYWVDFGEPLGGEVPYVRPALIIQQECDNIETVLVVPLTSQIDRSLDLTINPIITYSLNNNIYNCTRNAEKHIQKESQFLFAKMRSVDKSRLRSYMYRFYDSFITTIINSAIQKLTMTDSRKNAISVQSFSNTTIQIIPKKLTESQKKILHSISYKTYQWLKTSKQSEYDKTKKLLICEFNFLDDDILDLIVKCIQFAIHSTTNYYFNLNSFAKIKQTCALTYDQIVKNVSTTVKRTLVNHPKVKIGEFVSLMAMIIGGK